jgi:hypothetical protein
MRAECIIGYDSFSNQVGTLRLHPDIDVLTKKAERPAVKTAILQRRHIVVDEVAADLIAFTDSSPERTAVEKVI